MRAGFLSFAFGVQESKMLTVKTTEEGLGNEDGHIDAVAPNFNSRSYREKKKHVT